MSDLDKLKDLNEIIVFLEENNMNKEAEKFHNEFIKEAQVKFQNTPSLLDKAIDFVAPQYSLEGWTPMRVVLGDTRWWNWLGNLLRNTPVKNVKGATLQSVGFERENLSQQIAEKNNLGSNLMEVRSDNPNLRKLLVPTFALKRGMTSKKSF